MDKKPISFTRDDRKNIVNEIENLKNDKDFIAIFDILMNDESTDVVCSTNNNGVSLNLSVISDKTLLKVRNYLNRIDKKKKDSESSISPPLENTSNNSQRTHKLSNYEQNLLRHREIKQSQDNDTIYEELKFSQKIENQEDYPKNKKTSPAKEIVPIDKTPLKKKEIVPVDKTPIKTTKTNPTKDSSSARSKRKNK